MSQTTSKLIFQMNLPNLLEIKEIYYSPIFSIYNNMLLLQLEGKSYRLYLRPVPGSDKITWKECLKLSYKMFISEVRTK